MIYDDVESFTHELKAMLKTVLPDSEIIAVTTAEDALANLESCDLLILDIELENSRNGVGADAFLMKPVTPGRLKLCLQRISKKVKRDTTLISMKKQYCDSSYRINIIY